MDQQDTHAAASADSSWLARFRGGRGGSGRALRRRFTRLLVAAVVLPALMFAAVQLRDDYRTQRQFLVQQVRTTTYTSAVAIDQFLEAHVAGVALLADLTSAQDDAPDLLALRARYPVFVTALATDDGGRILELVPESRAGGRAVLPATDREYFAVPANTLQPHVSNAFRGRGLGHSPLVAVSAPIVRNGRFEGVIAGSIAVDNVAGQRSAIAKSRQQEMLIVDREGRVIHASAGLPFAFLQPLGDRAFLRGEEALDGVTPVQFHRGVLRDGGDAWVAWSRLRSGWRVAHFAPQQPLEAALWRHGLSIAGLLMLAVIGALIVAMWQIRRLARAIGTVLDALSLMAMGGRVADLKLDAVPGELRPIARAVAHLAGKLDEANVELRDALERQRGLSASLQQAVAAREREIAERTIELQEANAELERLSRTDPLTGALNVRGFRSDCEALVDGSGALLESITVLAFDVDHFKAYNDLYGHPAGDRVLRRVAGAAQAALRDVGDRVARVGGEEFVALLPGAGLETAVAVAERVRAAVAGLGIAHSGAPASRLSVSIGVVAADPGELLETALQQADEALYRAKHAGRDRVST